MSKYKMMSIRRIYKKRLLDGSIPLASRNKTTLDDRLENCHVRKGGVSASDTKEIDRTTMKNTYAIANK